MKIRFVTGFILLFLLIVMVVINIPIIDTLVVVIISLMGVYEYNKAFKSAGHNPIEWIGYFGCLFLFGMGGLIPNADKMLVLRLAVPAAIILIFTFLILTKQKRNVVDVAITALSLAYIPFMFSFIKLVLAMEHGRFLIWFIFFGAFASDTMAFLVGYKFGKRKLCPELSPKKTVEGSIAGIIAVVITYIVLALIGNHYFDLNINILVIIIAGIIVGIAGQFGDLSASAIKRYCKIKDFGSLMPGHGGILDRCDSILFVAPIVYMFFKVYLFL